MRRLIPLLILPFLLCFCAASSSITTKYYVAYTAADQGASSRGSLKYLIDSIGSKNATIVFPHTLALTQTTTGYTFSTNETCPANITIEVENGAVLTFPTGGIKLTQNGPFKADLVKGLTVANTTTGLSMGGSVYPEWWGAKADYPTTDDSDAIRKAAACLVSATRGKLVFSGGQYRVFSDGVTTTLGAFSSMNSIEIAFEGSELVIDRTFASAETIYCFTFSDCDQISFKSPRAWCSQTQPVNEKTSRGAYFAEFSQGCNGISSDIASFNSLRGGWNFQRLYTDPTSYACRNVDLGTTYAVDTGYPLFGTLSPYQMKATLRTLRCGRSYFVSGFYDHEVEVFSADHEAAYDCLIATDYGLGADGLKLRYTNTESTGTDASLAGIYIEFQDSDAYDGSHRNIDIELNIITDAARYIGRGLTIGKTLVAGGADATDRGHILENISLHGSIKGNSGSQASLGICSIGTWGVGEYVRNIRFHDLRIDGTAQPSFHLESLKDIAIFDNVYSSTQMNIYGNTTAKIICMGVDSEGSLTETTADTALVDYISCAIGSSTNQSIINKTFTNTYIGADLTNSDIPTAGKEFFMTAPIGSVIYTSMGTEVNHVNGTIYTAEIWVDHDVTLTGIKVLNGATVGTDKLIVALLDWHGTVLANSALAGTTSSGANAFQTIPFTATKKVLKGRHFISVQANGATDTIRTIAANTYMTRAVSQAGVFGTLSSITVPIAFTANTGPIAVAYE